MPCGDHSMLIEFHCSSARTYHKHAAIGANGFVIEVDAYHRVRAEGLCFLDKLVHRVCLGFFQYLLIRTAAATEKVAQAAKDIFKKIGSYNGLRSYHSEVVCNLSSFDVRGCCCDHC